MIFNKNFQIVLNDKIKDIGFSGGYLYFKPVDHILCGFCAADGRAGVYIEQYFFPLFDGCSELNLNFGKRLIGDEGYIDLNSVDSDEVPVIFSRNIKTHIQEVKKYLDVEYCYNSFTNNKYVIENIYRNPTMFKSYISFLVLLGDYDNALIQIEEKRKFFSIYDSEVVKQLEEIERSLLMSADKAIDLLLKWEKNIKTKLDIQV